MTGRSWFVRPRAAVLLGVLFLFAFPLFFTWTWQQIDLELSRPSPALLAIVAISWLVGSGASFAWAAGWKRGNRARSHDTVA
jgi:hypothetical protein